MKKVAIYLSFAVLLSLCFAANVYAEEGGGAGAAVRAECENRDFVTLSANTGDEGNASSFSAVSSVYKICPENGAYVLTDGNDKEVARGELPEVIDALPPEGASVSFSSVTLRKTLTVSGRRLAVSGTLTFEEDAGLVLSDGASLEIAGATLRFSKGGIRIKEGKLDFSSGYMESHACAVTMDYASDTSFRMAGGEILTTGADAAVKNLLGTVTVKGGQIRNAEGVAVYSEGTLRLGGDAKLSGGETDAVATLPITLTAENIPFAGSLRVKLLTTFQKGTETPAFYGAVAGMETRILLTDEEGEVCPLIYREEGENTDEKKYLAVSLPYRYPCYVNGTEVYVLYGFSEEVLASPEPPTRHGYEFSGWYTDSTLTEKMNFSAPPEKDTPLYAGFSLLPPTFSLSALSFSYDGELHDLTFSLLAHELAEKGNFSFEWYRGGELCKSSAKTLKLRNVSDSGTYFCKITFTNGTDSVTVTTPSVEVTVLKKRVEIPTPDEKIFNGQNQISTLFDTADYIVTENEGGVHAGEYAVVLTLRDPENSAFVGAEEESVTLFFRIRKGENSFLGEVKITDYFESECAAPFARARFGTPKFLYASSPDGVYSETPPTAVGQYYLSAVVEETADYAAIRSAPILFFVKKVTVLSLRVATLPEKTEYHAFECFLPTGLSVYATYSDGREEEVGLSALTFAYPDGESAFHVRSPYLFLSYEGASVTLPLTVHAAEYPMEGITFSDSTLVYDGAFHTIDFVGILPSGNDGSHLTASVVGGGTNAGVYGLRLVFATESDDYLAPTDMTATLTISPRKTQIFFGSTSFVYSGETQTPDAWYTDVYGNRVSVPVLGGKSAAGDGYTATACPSDGNYDFLCRTTEFSIAKATYDLSAAGWSDACFLYDGNKKTVVLTGLPEGVFVVGYANAEGVDAGMYTARVTLSYDAKNYREPVIEPYPWCIERAAYPVTYAFSDSVFVYDGVAHTPRMTGTLPVGADGSVPTPVFDRRVTHVSEGKCIVHISFSVTSKNYTVPDEVIGSVMITPAPAPVTWGSLLFTYTGAECLPVAKSEKFDVSVSGAMTDAGEYTAFARSLSDDYQIENDTVKFRILPAENHWISPLLPTTIYESTKFDGTVIPFYGKPTLRFFSDKELKNEIEMPRAHGVYYMRAEVAASRNYQALFGESVTLTLLEVLPVSLRVALAKDRYTAFDTLTPTDFSAWFLCNDGSLREADTQEIKVSYPNGDSFRTSDRAIEFAIGSFSVTLPVTVEKRVADLSGVKVSEEEFVYDGTWHTVCFDHLPSGFSVVAYEGAELLHAGDYTVTATLNFDSENYDAPSTLTRNVRVLRARVPLPVLASPIYDGTEKSPEVPLSDLYTLVHAQSGTRAGVYTVILQLVDPVDYVFDPDTEEEGDVCHIPFVIQPRKLVYELSDVTKYRGESTNLPHITLVFGEVLAGEDPRLHLEERDDSFVLLGENPDYTVEFSGGVITRTAKLSPAKIRTVFFFVLLGLLMLLILLFLYAKREQIRCRILWCREEHCARRARKIDLAAQGAMPSQDGGNRSDCPSRCENSYEGMSPSSEETADRAEEPVCPLTPTAENDESLTAATEEFPAKEEDLSGTDGDGAEAVCAETADALITDALARELLTTEEQTIPTIGNRRGVVNVDTLSRNFDGGERVDINLLKEKTLIPYDTGYLKILARGVIDKPLTVYADDFSLQAVKMIALTGGEAVRARTVPMKEKK